MTSGRSDRVLLFNQTDYAHSRAYCFVVAVDVVVGSTVANITDVIVTVTDVVLLS